MRANLILLCLVLFSISTYGINDSLIISEVMFNAEPGNNEYVEVYNAGSTPVTLLNCKIQYHLDGPDYIVPVAQDIIPPKSYAIILENDYQFSTGIYRDLIPQDAVLYVIDAAFGLGGMNDNYPRKLKLINKANEVVKTYTYTPNNLTGYSDELIVRSLDTSSSNWGNSITYNGSPGLPNTIIKYFDDLSLTTTINQDIQVEGDYLKLNFAIFNKGVNAANQFTLNLFNDVNLDSIATSNELIKSYDFTSLLAGDSLTFIDSLIVIAGDNVLIMQVDYTNDENLINNKNIIKYNVRNYYAFNDIVINEVKYNPLQGEGEWIEIFNKSEKPINIKGWKLADNAQQITLTNDSTLIFPNEYLVLTTNTGLTNFYKYNFNFKVCSIPSLNNDGDAVVIKDNFGNTIDSIRYIVQNTSVRNSLERENVDVPSINLSNWKYSEDRLSATPGRINSISQKNIDLIIKSASPTKNYFLINESFSLSVTLYNYGIQSSINSTLSLYNDLNNDNVYSPFEWVKDFNISNVNGKDSVKVILEASGLAEGKNNLKLFITVSNEADTINNDYYLSAFGVKLNEMRGDIVVNEIMYAPVNGEPEWIEIYNRSNKVINLNNYQIADLSSSNKILNYDFLFQPNSYMVISSDTILINYYPGLSFITASFNTLNNINDNIIFRDSLGRTIDSVFYTESYGGTNGKSLERIDVNASSTDKNNWRTSKQPTPGRFNFSPAENNNLAIAGLSFIDEFSLKLRIYIQNKGTSNANFLINLYEDVNLDSVVDNLIEQKELTLNAGDSIEVIKDLTDKNVKGYVAEIIYSLDEDTSDNISFIIYKGKLNSTDVVINEVMLDNENGKSWIEFYNKGVNSFLLKDKILKVNNTQYKLDTFIVIQPQKYFILTNDKDLNFQGECIYKYFPNIDDDKIAFLDSSLTIDSLDMSILSHSENQRSFERINIDENTNLKSNWTKSLSNSGSTIGIINSNINISSYSLGSIKINEVMFNPSADDNEYIEIYNPTDNAVDIGAFEFYDAEGFRTELSKVSYLLNPDSYYVISSDTLLFRKHNIDNNNVTITTSSLMLNNDEDKIFVKDPFGNIIDSLSYWGDWLKSDTHTSIENVEGNKWKASVSTTGGTPGYKNSVEPIIEPQPLHENLSITPNPFSPDDDGFEDIASIGYNTNYLLNKINLKVFDSRGRLINNLNYDNLNSKNGCITFDGKDSQGNYLKMGIYILLIEYHSAENNFSEQFKKTIVVARKL